MVHGISPAALSRRLVLLGGLAACTVSPAPAPHPRMAPDLRPSPNTGFDAWLRGFRQRAQARGIPAPVLDRALDGAGFLPGVVTRDRTQFHTRRTLEDSIAVATSDDRIATGKAMLRRHAALLARIEARYGVPPEIVTAIWGHESIYGQRRGDVPTISALATLAFAGRRRAFFESQLIAAVNILARGEVAPDHFLGSWAGAMGHTQFIPTTYLAHAVDFGGDGRRDVWSDDPTDALASAAAYLNRSGWRRGGPWGIEVILPAGAPASGRQSVAGWRATGVRTATGGVIPDHGTASLITPAGRGGPAFLLFHNAAVLRRYNDTLDYVLAVGHLADRLKGGGPIKGRFAPDAQGLSLAERKDIQRLLADKGYDTGTVDGVIGPATQAAIRAYEQASGLPVTGQATLALLARLRG